MAESSAEARECHRIIRASVRKCVETWTLQNEAGPVTVEALEAIVARSTVPILRCACGSSGAAACGAGDVMAWERARGEGARGRGGC